MNNQHKLRDTLVGIQGEIDDTIKLINQAVSGGPRTLLGVTEQLKIAREATVAAELLIGVLPKGLHSPQSAEIQRVRPGPLGSVVRSSATKKKKCPFCDQMPSAKQLEDHIAQFHRQPLSSPSMPPGSMKGQAQQPSAKAAPAPRPAIAHNEMPPKRCLMTCPICRVAVREDRLNRHVAKMHPQAVKLPAPTASNNKAASNSHATSAPKKSTRKGTSVTARSQAYLSNSYDNRDVSLEALDQSYRDRRDGGKELSQSRRDHGQFGSFPVHDDYSEDSYS